MSFSLPCGSYLSDSSDADDLCPVPEENPGQANHSNDNQLDDDDQGCDDSDNSDRGLITAGADFYRDGDVVRQRRQTTDSSDNEQDSETPVNTNQRRYKSFVPPAKQSRHGDDSVRPSMDSSGDEFGFGNRKRKLSEASSEDDSVQKPKESYEFDDRIKNLVTTAKRPKVEETVGYNIMQRMGYQSGQGLGKSGQGRVEPIELSKQKGRRGLGSAAPSLTPEDLVFDSTQEVVQEKEHYEWLSCVRGSLGYDTLQSWIEIGPKDLSIENMTTYVDANLLKHILNGKSVFDSLTGEELLKARSRSNPFETLKSGIFLNRAALKMANMDAVFDFMFTNPKIKDDEDNLIPMVGKDELLYFADVCAGPGGFSEYVLWRRKWRCKGFGFTLKGDCDFKLDSFFAGSPGTFETYYGAKEDGNVFDPDNITSLRDLVMRGTDSKGVHFMMADGGFSVDGQENIQELLSKQLYLCQFLVALTIVRNNGHFVCKLFDLFSPFSAGLVYLMYRSFKSICLFKPNTSRPANSERYIICKHKRSDCGPIRDYMFELNLLLIRLQRDDPDSDIVSIVPQSLLTGEEGKPFYDYLVESNNSLGQRQVVNLMKIAAFCRDPNLVEARQAELRSKCLKLWDVPDRPRASDRSGPDDVIKEICGVRAHEILRLKPAFLTPNKPLADTFGSILDWVCIPCSQELNFYLGLGRSKVYRYDLPKRGWVIDDKVRAELNPGTLVYGEVIPELKGEGRGMVQKNALHIIDGFSIGFETIANLPYAERIKMLKLYCKALDRVRDDCVCPVRVKESYELQNINDIFKQLTMRFDKQMTPILVIENERFKIRPRAIVFINIMKPPWTKKLSKSTGHVYFQNPETKRSEYLRGLNLSKDNIDASARECIERLLLWKFDEGVGLQREGKSEGVLHKDELLEFVSS